jgi:hypothetical protein
MDYICTWIYLDNPDESSEYPQVGKQSHLPAFQLIYWRCIALFYALSTRFNPDRRHILFSNKDWDQLPEVDGLDLANFLKSKNVELVVLPLTWQTPPGYFGKWRNQFYIFDVLQLIETKYNHADDFIVLDSDCLINQPLDALFAQLRKEGLLALPMSYADGHVINGVTREDMRQIYTELDGKDPGFNPIYYGGEILAASYIVVEQLNAMAPRIWQAMLQRFEKGLPKLNEEAHFLSYCYFKIGKFDSLDAFIKRIWTAPHYNNVVSKDAALPIWHLPSEKTGGIALLFKKVCLEGKEFSRAELGGYVGVPTRKHFLNTKHFFRYSWLYKFIKKHS